ncbi:tetratricopeptide repeat protein [bacterium]|nr:tetratricopeptide repeat protein [bacterium]
MKVPFLFFLLMFLFLSCGSVEQQPSQDEQNLALLQHNVASSDLFLVEGKRLLAVQEYQKAEAKIRQSKAKESPFYLAITLQAQEKTTEAETLFKQAINDKIFIAESWYNLAMIAHQKGDNEQALQMATKAVDTDKTHAGAHFILGSFAFDKSDFDTALTHFQIITESAPDIEAGWSGVVNVLSLQKKWQDIWNKKERLLQFPSLVIFVAQAAEKTGNQKEVIALLQKQKMNLVVALQYIVLLSQSGAAAKAIATAHALQKQSPGILLVDRDKPSRMALFLNPEGALMFICGKNSPLPISLNQEAMFVNADGKTIGKRADLIALCGNF